MTQLTLIPFDIFRCIVLSTAYMPHGVCFIPSKIERYPMARDVELAGGERALTLMQDGVLGLYARNDLIKPVATMTTRPPRGESIICTCAHPPSRTMEEAGLQWWMIIRTFSEHSRCSDDFLSILSNCSTFVHTDISVYHIDLSASGS